MQLTEENQSGDDENAETMSVTSQTSTTGSHSAEEGMRFVFLALEGKEYSAPSYLL